MKSVCLDYMRQAKSLVRLDISSDTWSADSGCRVWAQPEVSKVRFVERLKRLPKEQGREPERKQGEEGADEMEGSRVPICHCQAASMDLSRCHSSDSQQGYLKSIYEAACAL